MTAWTLESLSAKGLTYRQTGGAGVAVLEKPAKARAHKYNARKCERNGRVFDSIAEADRADQLELLQRARVIRGLGYQPVYALCGASGRAVASYKADFCYFENGRQVCEDVKGFATPTWRLKRKLFLEQYPDITLKVTDGKGNLKAITARYPRAA